MNDSDARWRQRFRATRTSIPLWARDLPERVVFSSNAGGKWELYAWERGQRTPRRFTDRPEGTTAGAISPDGETLWWFDDAAGNEFGRWMTQPFQGGSDGPAIPDLPPGYGGGLALGRRIVVLGLAADGMHRIYAIPTGEPARLLYEHGEGGGAGPLSRDETLLAISHAEHGDSRHPALRVLRPSGERVADLWDGPGLGLSPQSWSPLPGDGRLLVMHERGDARRPLLWTPMLGEERLLNVDLPGEVRASWFPDASALLIIHDYRGRSALYRLELADETLTAIDTPPGVVAQAWVRPEGALWLQWSNASTPPFTGEMTPIRYVPAATSRPASSPSVKQLFPDDELSPAGDAQQAPRAGDAPDQALLRGAPYQELDVDGIPAWLAEPAGARPHPTLVWVHGGPQAHDRDEFSPRVQAFVDHGIAVVLVNYRGSSGYGRAWRDAITGNPGLTELADVAAVRDAVVARGIADEARLALGGGSWGGYLTLLGLGVRPDLWTAGVAAVPVADYVAAYEDEMEGLQAYDRALFGGAPTDIPEVYRERSPITYVEQVRAPLLILAGENDPRCPIRQIDNYLERLRQRGYQPDVYRYQAGHGSLVTEETIHQMEVMLAFLAREIGSASVL